MFGRECVISWLNITNEAHIFHNRCPLCQCVLHEEYADCAGTLGNRRCVILDIAIVLAVLHPEISWCIDTVVQVPCILQFAHTIYSFCFIMVTVRPSSLVISCLLLRPKFVPWNRLACLLQVLCPTYTWLSMPIFFTCVQVLLGIQ